jgi:hypothetical protein
LEVNASECVGCQAWASGFVVIEFWGCALEVARSPSGIVVWGMIEADVCENFLNAHSVNIFFMKILANILSGRSLDAVLKHKRWITQN